MAHELPYIAAINEAITLEMERDDTVLYFGQNMATTENEPYVDAFGKDRVRVTPISETAEIGMAIGAALEVDDLVLGFIGLGIDVGHNILLLDGRTIPPKHCREQPLMG